MAPLYNLAFNLNAGLGITLPGRVIPNTELIRMTLRRLIFKKILDPETIIEEIAHLPDLRLNGPGVVLAAIRGHNSYQALEQHLRWLRGVNSVAELLSELLNMAIVGGFGTAMICIVSWRVGIPCLLCALPWIYAILARVRLRGHVHILILTWILFVAGLFFFVWMIYAMVDHKNGINKDFMKLCNQTMRSLSNTTDKSTILTKCEELKEKKLSTHEERLSLADSICQVFLTLLNAFLNLCLIA